MGLRATSTFTSGGVISPPHTSTLQSPGSPSLMLSTGTDPLKSMPTYSVPVQGSCSRILKAPMSDSLKSATVSSSGRGDGESIYFDAELLPSDMMESISSSSQYYIRKLSGLAIMCAQLLEQCSSLYPQLLVLLYLFWMKLKVLPSSLSSLLPDNLVLVDFLGRSYSLQYQYFRNWSMVRHLLIHELKECYGADRIGKGAFLLEVQVSRNTFRKLDPKQWSQVPPRSKIVMSATLKILKTASGICPRCRGFVHLSSAGSWSCGECLISFQGLNLGTRSSLDHQHIQSAMRKSRELDSCLLRKARLALIDKMKGYNQFLQKTRGLISSIRDSERTCDTIFNLYVRIKALREVPPVRKYF